MSIRGVLFSIVVVMASVASVAQEEPTIKVRQLTDRIHMLSTDQGAYTTNSLVLTGEDGILLVDTQAASDAAALKEAVEGFGKGAPRIIINTHRHVEHIGGNAIFGDEPVIIAHDLVPGKLKSGSYIFEEFPAETYPDITFSDSMTLHFNGETIVLRAMGGSHDDNEIIVHFVESKVAHLSSLVNGFNFPSVDGDGDALKFAELVGKAMEILPDDVLIVSGHNDVGKYEQLGPYHEMLVGAEAKVRKGLEQGKDLAALREEKVLGRWERYAGSYVSVDRWTEYLVDAVTEKKDGRKKVFEPLYHAWKKDGAEAAVKLYFDLKSNHADEYRAGELTLLVIGDKLVEKGDHRGGIAFLEASLKDEPESRYGYYTHYRLAEAYDRVGERERALEYCDRALELRPEFKPAADLKAKLK